MDRRTKTKLITTIVCMALSRVALYAFAFVIDVAVGWRIALIVIAVCWLVDGTIHLIGYSKKK